jgi:hypothetical protein
LEHLLVQSQDTRIRERGGEENAEFMDDEGRSRIEVSWTPFGGSKTPEDRKGMPVREGGGRGKGKRESFFPYFQV